MLRFLFFPRRRNAKKILDNTQGIGIEATKYCCEPPIICTGCRNFIRPSMSFVDITTRKTFSLNYWPAVKYGECMIVKLLNNLARIWSTYRLQGNQNRRRSHLRSVKTILSYSLKRKHFVIGKTFSTMDIQHVDHSIPLPAPVPWVPRYALQKLNSTNSILLHISSR